MSRALFDALIRPVSLPSDPGWIRLRLAIALLAAGVVVLAVLAVLRVHKARQHELFRTTLLMPGTRLIAIRKGTGPGNHAWDGPSYRLGITTNAVVSAVFWVKFSDERGSRPFDFSCKGKIGGFYIGQGGYAAGGHAKQCGPRAASLRVMWSKEGDAYAYVYTPEGKERMQPPPLNGRCGEVEVFRDQFRGVFKTRGPKGDGWHRINLMMRLNTPGKADGFLTMSVNYVLRTLHGVMWRTTPKDGIESFMYQVFHGGPCKCQRDCHMQLRGPSVTV